MYIYIYIYTHIYDSICLFIVSVENGVLLRSPGPEKHQPSIWPILLCFCWLSWLMVVRARFKQFGNIIWQISPMFEIQSKQRQT